jgi:glycosyltransferase involved in cell wall biosynthesis
MRRFVEVSYTYADMISPVSSWNSRWEQRLGATPERIFPIPNGVDPDRFAPKPMPERAKPTLVWVGRIDPLKDVITLLEAAALVAKTVPNFQLLIFGKAPLGNEAYDALCRKRWTELHLESCVHFMGFAPSPQEAYVQGHAVVLSSISEAMPYSVIEAMCCGRPVIGTAVGGVPEVIADTGAVVSPRDPAELAEACIQMLLNLDVCEMLGDAARDRALGSYSLRGFLTSYRSLYDLAAPGEPAEVRWPTSLSDVSGKKIRQEASRRTKDAEKLKRRLPFSEENPTGLRRLLGTISAVLPSW